MRDILRRLAVAGTCGAAALAGLAPAPASAVDFEMLVRIEADGTPVVRLPDGRIADPKFGFAVEPGDRLFWRVVPADGVDLADWRVGITDIADFWGVIGRWGARPRRDSRQAKPYRVAPVWPMSDQGTQYTQVSTLDTPPAQMNFRLYSWPADLGDRPVPEPVHIYLYKR